MDDKNDTTRVDGYSTGERDDQQFPGSGQPQDRTMTVGRYIATRLSSLKPPMDRVENPIKLLMLLNTKQWLFFLVGFIGWTWDAFDFFSVSLTVSDLALTFNKSTKAITWGITLVLMYASIYRPSFRRDVVQY